MKRSVAAPSRVVLGLLLFYLVFNATVDLQWVIHAHELPALMPSHWIARLYQGFAAVDHGYFDRVGQGELALETVNITLTQALYVLLLVALLRRWPVRVALQIGIGAAMAYSVLFNWTAAAVTGFANMDERSLGSFALFFGASSPWLLGHLYFVADGWRQARHALAPVPGRRTPAARQTPDFESARLLRQQARAAGLDPNHWYAVTQDRRIGRRGIHEAQFQGLPVVVFRDEAGVLHAIENRCRHRGIKLSLGEVSGCTLVCPYHGWAYRGDGSLASVAHETHGRDISRIGVRSFPVRVRYGLVWIFPGDPRRADETAMPEIPEIEGPKPWACVPLEFTWDAHHSMIIDNLSDLTHGYLHRHFQPFADPVLTHHERRGDAIHCIYKIRLMQNPVIARLIDRKGVDMDTMDLCFDYPYQWGNTGNRVKHWVFLMPLDARTTRVFFLFYFNEVQLPFTRFHIPQRLMGWVIRLLNPVFIRPLVSQDGEAVAWEQSGYEGHFDRPEIELNPAVPMFQRLTVEKWRAHLDRTRPLTREAAE